jgi:hypothetical protein
MKPQHKNQPAIMIKPNISPEHTTPMVDKSTLQISLQRSTTNKPKTKSAVGSIYRPHTLSPKNHQTKKHTL